MRVVNVLGAGPEGEGEELGTAETLIEAERIGKPAGWYRVYGPDEMVHDSNDIDLSYSWHVERGLWVSEDAGAYGEPLTIPVSADAGDRTQGVTHYIHTIVEVTDPPSRCARCDVVLNPGADSWYALDCKRAFDLCHNAILEPGTKAQWAYDSEREIGVACQDCGGRSPDLSHLL